MECNVCCAQALKRLVGEHLAHQVFELCREEAFRVSLLVGFPELVHVTSADEIEVWVFQVCLDEGSISGIHHEDHDSESKPVDNLKLIISVR